MSTISKTLEFPLPVTTLTRAKCSKLSSVLIGAALPQVGVVSTFPRALVHGPKKFFGLEVPDFYIKQGVAHVEKLVRLSKSSKHPTACLLRHSAEARMRVQLGCNGPIFHIPWQCHILMEASWLKSTWEFVHEFGIQIDDDIPELQTWRENDVLLVPLFLRLGYTGVELRWLNMCRLYYRVSWLSEICSGDGLRLLRMFLANSANPNDSTLRYPKQGFPPSPAWKIWKKALSSVCDSNQVLYSPLGNWVSKTNWLYDPVSERLYKKKGDVYAEYQSLRKRQSRNSWATFGYPVETSEIPCTVLPATVLYGDRHPVMTGFSNLAETHDSEAMSFQQYLSKIIIIMS
jgi:hypothetical protein